MPLALLTARSDQIYEVEIQLPDRFTNLYRQALRYSSFTLSSEMSIPLPDQFFDKLALHTKDNASVSVVNGLLQFRKHTFVVSKDFPKDH